jgi:hypothetical protein
MLAKKWNVRVKVLLNYLIIVIFLYLEALHSFGEYVSTFVEHNHFGRMPHITIVDTKFWKLLEPCSNQCNATFCMVKSNDLWLLWFFLCYDTMLLFLSLMELLCHYITLLVSCIDNCWNLELEFQAPIVKCWNCWKRHNLSSMISILWHLNERICYNHKPRILCVCPCHLKIRCWDSRSKIHFHTTHKPSKGPKTLPQL